MFKKLNGKIIMQIDFDLEDELITIYLIENENVFLKLKLVFFIPIILTSTIV